MDFPERGGDARYRGREREVKRRVGCGALRGILMGEGENIRLEVGE